MVGEKAGEGGTCCPDHALLELWTSFHILEKHNSSVTKAKSEVTALEKCAPRCPLGVKVNHDCVCEPEMEVKVILKS